MSGSQLPEVRTVGQEAEARLGPAVFQSEEIFFPTRLRTTRARVKAARSLIPVLKQTLEAGETVRFISAGGYTYDVWEHMFGAGAWATYVNGATLVCTDRRLLLFNVKHPSRSPKDIKNAIALSDIKSVRRFAGNLTFRLRDNTKIRVATLPFADARELRSRLQREIENPMRASTPLVSGMKSLQHLCPACCKPVTNVNALQCVSCRAEFRSGRTAAFRSLLLPGLGDIYLKHTVLGALELIGSVILWLVFLSVLFFGDGGAITSILLLLAIATGIDYFVTKAMARKGIVAK